MTTETRVAVVQHVFYGNGEVGANKILAVPEEFLTATELDLLRSITGMCPSEGEVTDEQLAALEELQGKCEVTDLPSLFDNIDARHVVTVWCQLVYG